MSSVSFNQTYTGNATITIPSDAFNISLVVAGGRGGSGGSDSGGNGGGGGSARRGYFSLPNYVARTLTLQPGGAGQDGPGCFGRGTGRSSGSISGGGGGSASGCSGSGGGGGGGSGVYDSTVNGYIIVAGGGGGGGGGAWNRGGGGGGSAGGFSNVGGIGAGGGADGNGAACGDGSGGGGGGGGAGGGGAGSGGCDNGSSATGGGAGGSQYRAAQTTLTGQDSYGGGGYITLSYTAITPEISFFDYSPKPQSSGTVGTPSNVISLNWTVVDAALIEIYDGATLIHSTTSVNGPLNNVNTGLQSVAGSNSPATKTYTLKAYATTSVSPAVTVTSSITVQVYNDNTPSSVPIPTKTTTNVSLSSLEPNTEYIVAIGNVTGLDMKTLVTCNTLGLQASVSGGGGWSNSIVIDPGTTFYLKFFSLVFNTDPSGLTNPKTFNFSVGTSTNSFTATTRAPDVNESFDAGVNTTIPTVPYPEIDQAPETPSQYLYSTKFSVNDVEIDVPIKTNNPDAQVRITSGGIVGGWVDVQSI